MTAPAPDFDAAREAYEAARFERDRIIGNPDKTVTPDQYREQIRKARQSVVFKHAAMLEAWK